MDQQSNIRSGNANTGNSDVYTREYFDSFVIEMRVVGSTLASTQTELLGIQFPTPVLMGVIGGYDRLGEDALRKHAQAARELDNVICLSSHETDEEIAMCVKEGARVIGIVKPFADREDWLYRLKKMEELGCVAVGTDIDHGYDRQGGYDQIDGLQLAARTIDDLKEAVDRAHVPFIAKGVLSVQDALACREAGCAAIVVSHHHNIMNYAAPPLMLLPGIRRALGDSMTIFADCGISSGANAFKALAMGADAVFVARPVMTALVKDGKEGAEGVIRQITGELQSYLNRTSSPDAQHIDPTVLHRITG